MRLINVKAFLKRESLIKEGKPVDHCTQVLQFGNDEATEYAILSHRWVGKEVGYDEMIELAKMDGKARDEIRQRDGYQKIIQSCEQTQKEGYEWLWVDTCCIDKRSSAELHDVPDPQFPTAKDHEKYPDFSGWPEWFSRGWTLQELIAPSNVQFLVEITGIPEHILIHGLHGNRPCVAQIMSWAAHRTTTRVEDRAYSLMGLLDVNMPMLYGEGKKSFHRLQLEIIRASNDQSIFAWDWKRNNQQPGSILADDPSFFERCGIMELMDHGEFIQFLNKVVPEEELDSIEDRLGTFSITNRGIQIWMLLRPRRGSRSLFQASLPCLRRPMSSPVTIDLVLWESNYYRCNEPYFPVPAQFPPEGPLRLRQVYLRYQDPPHRNSAFEIDDSALIGHGFTCCDAYPKKFTGNTLMLTSTDPLCVKVYSDSLTNHHFVVGLEQFFGKDWIHVISDEYNIIPQVPWEYYAVHEYFKMKVLLEHAQAMNKARSGAERYGRICIMQTRLPQTTKILQTSSVMWKSSRMCGVKLEVFHDPNLSHVSGEWTAFDVDGTDDPGCDWRGLMMLDRPSKYFTYKIDEVPMVP
ncbi:hypothetical protein SCLCIDRAFT_1217428, partial [Scleroderma citrinum Foug A]